MKKKKKSEKTSFVGEARRPRSIESVIDLLFNTMEALEEGRVSPFVARSMAQNAAVAVAAFRTKMDQQRLIANRLLPMASDHSSEVHEADFSNRD